MHQSLVT